GHRTAPGAVRERGRDRSRAGGPGSGARRRRGGARAARGGRRDMARMVVPDERGDDLGSDGVHGPRAPDAPPGGGTVGRDLSAEDRELRALLGDVHTIAVVWLSSRPGRPSFEVASYLQDHGYRIVPVNPNETTVLGEPAYPPFVTLPHHCSSTVADVL